jgi:uncharacterized protein YndB with AHSA1/START domain
MPVTDITKDIDQRTIVITAEFAAPVERIWAIYADPRQLERIWGPPTWPATFVDHELAPGETSRYYMTGPDGTRAGGWWRIVSVDEPRSFTFDDGFADADLNPVDTMPVSHSVFAFEAVDGGTRATFTSVYDTAEDLQKVLEMGVEEGATGAINQIDELLVAA